MTTNIDINPELIEQAMQVSGQRTKKAVVNLALEEFVRHRKQQQVLELFGQVDYEPGYDYKAYRAGGEARP
ncbi:MAG: type II toxin-antitoxin system VapB family antitoxin [Planctomycetota bacterium]